MQWQFSLFKKIDYAVTVSNFSELFSYAATFFSRNWFCINILWKSNGSILGVEETLSRRKRDRDLESVKILSERQNLHAYLSKKAFGFSLRLCSSENIIWGWGRNGQDIGNKEMLMLLSMKPIENLNVRDWSSIKRLNGPIRLKERRTFYSIWRIGNEKQSLAIASRKRLPIN